MLRPRRTVSVIGTGSYLPERILHNADLEKLVETSDDWITSRTGIKERRIAAEGENTSDLAAKAALAALENARITADQIDLILVATVTPDMFFPSTACFVQTKIGAKNAACFDVSAACSGFLYALEIAQQFISSRTHNTILIIGAERLSSIVDWSDRNTCVLFGDGAGAAVLLPSTNGGGKILSSTLGTDGAQAELLNIPGGGSACPALPGTAPVKPAVLSMQGREVFKHAVNAMRQAAIDGIAAAGLTIADIDLIIPHQANLRIIDAIVERLDFDRDNVFINLDKYGNTSAAAVAIALDEANRQGRIKPGDRILLVAFGAGLTWASAVIEW